MEYNKKLIEKLIQSINFSTVVITKHGFGDDEEDGGALGSICEIFEGNLVEIGGKDLAGLPL